ncbi:MAG: prenyltransferase [Pseudomonadota bacterium]
MTVAAWVRAARPAAQSNIAPSLILGQVLALALVGQFSWSIFAWLLLFGVFDQLYIVFANDVADVETDRRNHTATPFSGGSRVLTDGQLSRRDLAIAALLCAVLLVSVTGVLAVAYARPLAPIFAGLAVLLLWAYSYRPLRLSYRGGGELLQVLGIGVVLPTLGYYAQAGTLSAFPWLLLLATLPMQLAGAIGTALPDEPSDRESAKRTLAVRLGQGGAQRLALALQLLASATFVAVSPLPIGRLAAGAVIAVPTLLAAIQWRTPQAVPGQRSMLLRVLAILSANALMTVGIIIVALV